MTHAVFNPPPGWPAPPEGWVPPANWQPDPSWPPVPPGWQLWVHDTAPVQEATQWPAQWTADPAGPSWPSWPTPPRSKAARVWLTLAIVLGPPILFFVGAVAVLSAIQPGEYTTQAEYDQAVDGVANLIQGGLMLAYFVAYASMAPKVSFRWFDAFFLLVPIYGWVFQFRIAYRMAFLPHRDWALRPEEMARGVRTSHPSGGTMFGAAPGTYYLR
jgi:hypothetical protein